MFACRDVDVQDSDPYGLAHLQTSTWAYGYWSQDMAQACYSGEGCMAWVG